MPVRDRRELAAILVAALGFGTWILGAFGAQRQAPAAMGLIAYVARDGSGQPQVFTVAPDGSRTKQLTRTAGEKAFPAWSQDRRKLAFTWVSEAGPQLWAMNSDGSGQRQLTFPPGSGNMVPTWSPDGTHIAFTSVRTGHPEIWMVDTAGGGQRQLTSTPTPGGSNAPSWSPDGSRIAFASDREGRTEVYTVKPDGSEMRRLTEPLGPAFWDSNVPVWSPDGRRIAFWSGIETQYGQVWVMDADGRNRRPLPACEPPHNCDNPAWSPDGSQILFETNQAGPVETWVMGADGSNPHRLLGFPYGAGRLPW
jgi:tol-pal system beta propeller repeat protein TolB